MYTCVSTLLANRSQIIALCVFLKNMAARQHGSGDGEFRNAASHFFCISLSIFCAHAQRDGFYDVFKHKQKSNKRQQGKTKIKPCTEVTMKHVLQKAETNRTLSLSLSLFLNM